MNDDEYKIISQALKERGKIERIKRGQRTLKEVFYFMIAIATIMGIIEGFGGIVVALWLGGGFVWIIAWLKQTFGF